MVAGEKGVHWRKQLVAFTVASSSAMIGWAKVTHCGVVKVPRHVAQDLEMANSGESIRSGCDSGGYGGWSRIVAGVHPRCDISYPFAVIHLRWARITVVDANLGARSPAVRHLNLPF